MQPVDHGLEGHAAIGMGLRIEKDFGQPDIVPGCPLEIGPGHVEEVLLGLQHTGAGVIDIEKTLQVGEGIGRTQCLDIGIRQGNPVAPGQRKNQLRLKAALDMDMQFGLGHGQQQGIQAVRFGHWLGD